MCVFALSLLTVIFESDSCDVLHESNAHHVKSPVQAVEYADS